MLRICPSQKKFKKILFYDQVFYIKDLCTIEKKKHKQKKDVELMEAFLCYEFGGLTFRGAYTWTGLLSKFCRILFQHRSCTRSTMVTIFYHKDNEVNIRYLESTVIIKIFFVAAPLFWKSWRGFKQLPAMERMNNKITNN